MKQILRLADFRAMDAQEQRATLKELVDAARSVPNGDLHDLEALIASFEEEFGMSSETLRDRVSMDAVEETDAVCAWLILLKRRDHLARLQARSHSA